MKTLKISAAPYDAFVKGISIGLLVFFVGIEVVMIVLLNGKAIIPGVILLAALGLIFGIGWFFRVLHYSIEDQVLKIHRPSGDLEFSIDAIKDTQILQTQDSFKAIRTMGMGGIFGFWGNFYNSSLGHFKLYTTCWKPVLLIKFKENWVGISPLEPETIENKLRILANLPDKE